MNILLDENLPRALKRLLPEHEVKTVQDMGWAGYTNGLLLARAEGQFDLLLTADKNLRYQQNLQGRTLAILVLPSNRLSIVYALEAQITARIAQMASGEYQEL